MGRKKKRRSSGFCGVLDQYKVLQSIADDYDLRILQIEKKNGVFQVNTSQGWKKVKFFKYSQPELDYVHGALEHLAGKGWKRSMPLHLTKDGSPSVETPQGLVYVSTWVQGTEIDPEDPFHLEMAVKVLGEMHRLLQDYPGVGECHRQIAPDWQDKYGRQAEELERYRQQAESARRGKFGRRFCQVADDLIRMMGIGLQLLDEVDYEQVSQEAQFITTCHTSPIASNLITGTDGKIYVIDFDNARADLRVYDLGRMLIRHSDWDIDKALFLIKSYQEANPLTQEEMAILPALCALSNRGWQVARSFYEQGKIHLGRLEKAVEELAKQEAFVKAFAQIQPSKLVHSPVQLFQTIPYPLPVLAETELEEVPVADVPGFETQEKDETKEIYVDTSQELQLDSHLDTETRQETKEFDHLPQPFYWGDEDTELEQLEAEKLWALRQELASLARRLETISSAMFTEEFGGGDEWMGEGEISQPSQGDSQADVVIQPGREISAEIPRGREETPTLVVMAEVGKCPSDMGEEIEVCQSVENLDLQRQKEGKVRLDLAIDMEHTNWEVPIEESVSLGENSFEIVPDTEMPVLTGSNVDLLESIEPGEIKPGKEIPVEYAMGLEEVEDKEVIHGDHEVVRGVVSEIVTEELPIPPETLKVSSVMTDVVAKAESPPTAESEEETLQVIVITDQVNEAMPVSEDKASEVLETWEAATPASKEPDPEPETEIVSAEETRGEKMNGDETHPELISSSSRTRGSAVVEWANFPEPLGTRRRARDSRSL